MAIKIAGHINENGLLQFAEHVGLPARDVVITIEPVSAGDETAEAAFDDLYNQPEIVEGPGIIGNQDTCAPG